MLVFILVYVVYISMPFAFVCVSLGMIDSV